MFLAFQYPVAIPGVTVANFLRSAVKARRGADVPVREFRKELLAAMEALDVDPGFAGRYLNDGFSGGEKKRLEILQMAMLKPASGAARRDRLRARHRRPAVVSRRGSTAAPAPRRRACWSPTTSASSTT